MSPPESTDPPSRESVELFPAECAVAVRVGRDELLIKERLFFTRRQVEVERFAKVVDESRRLRAVQRAAAVLVVLLEDAERKLLGGVETPQRPRSWGKGGRRRLWDRRD
eukprot:scaffold72828_cov69-Phaeocystis_antarctica.AAC.1